MLRKEIEKREKIFLSPYACHATSSKGREKPEREDDIRTCFMRDRDRIVHSKAFRRLKHKTQVYISRNNDHYRTRMTHTLEVSQIARTVGRALRLNEDLIEAAALAHDVGHTPFAHVGEEVLDRLLPEGFRHNENSVRVLSRIEKRGSGEPLNLSCEVLDAVLNHNGFGENEKKALTLEGQVIRFSDKIAYVQHDIDDSVRAGLLCEKDLPGFYTKVLGDSHGKRIGTLVTDIVMTSLGTMEAGEPAISLSAEKEEALKGLRSYLFKEIYRGEYCYRERETAGEMVESLFRYYCERPEEMPAPYMETVRREGLETGIADYISGMSDYFCSRLYREKFPFSPISF